ncbi:MAG TPA: nitroreductase/quinone reductase family protein [Thermomicrobiales bacterium]|nr:nitroreductase/quinone reductase family protein [Thermomicrobiales bacterium]
MNERVCDALARDRTIDITTIGRSSGLPRRIETWFYRVNDEIFLTGSPGRRDWYANLLANPGFTFHLKQSVAADLPARATPITDPDERRAIIERILSDLGGTEDLEAWVEGSPLMVVRFNGRYSGKVTNRGALVDFRLVREMVSTVPRTSERSHGRSARGGQRSRRSE